MVCDKLQEESVVVVPSPFHIILFIVNIFLPGWGTMISSCCSSNFNPLALIVGVIQFITAPILIGWVWSIIWGWLIFKKS